MEAYIWYDEALNLTICCHISYYLRRPVCQMLYIDGAHVPNFTGYISWLGLSDFILEPHEPSVKRLCETLDVPDKWDGRFRVPRLIGDVWARYLEPVSGRA